MVNSETPFKRVLQEGGKMVSRSREESKEYVLKMAKERMSDAS